MPQFKVKTPDGNVVTVNGPDGATEADAIAYAKQHYKPKPERSLVGAVGEGVRNIPKSAYEFGKDIYTTLRHPIDTAESLGNLGLGVMEELGIKTGDEHKKYAEAVGQMFKDRYGSWDNIKNTIATDPVGMLGDISTIAGGVGLAERAPGIAGKIGKAAGKVSEATNPVNAATKVAGKAAGALSPFKATPERQAAEEYLRTQEGVTATAGQATGNKPLLYAESHLGDAPFAGGKATQATNKIGRQFTRAVWRRAGVNAEIADAPTVSRAFKDIGREMDVIESQYNAKMDSQFVKEIIDATDKYHTEVQAGMTRELPNKILNDFLTRLQQSPTLTGKQFASFRSDLTEKLRAAGNDWQYSELLGDYIEAMNNMMARSMSNPKDWNKWQDLRRKYKNLIVIAKASTAGGQQAAEGIISPAHLKQALTSTKRGRKDYEVGRGEFDKLARAGNIVLTPMPSSGTAERGMLYGTAAGLAGASTALATGNPGLAAGMAASTAAPGIAGRAVMSRPAQAALRNQKAAPAARAAGQAVAPVLPSGLGAFQAGRIEQHQPTQITVPATHYDPRSPEEMLANPGADVQ